MMFKENECEQGSEEWFKARLGKITASNFSKTTTKTGKISASHEELINLAVAEIIIGEPQETFKSDAMIRGSELEDQALDFFNFTNGYNFKSCGFLDTGLGYGCSPDGIDYDNKIGLELKCPLPHTHLAYLAGGKLPNTYLHQVQGSMLVTGYKKWVFGSYHPDLPCFSIEVERDEKLIEDLYKNLIFCCTKVEENLTKLKQIMGDK